MIKRVKNIVNLTKILFQNSTAPYLIDKKSHKINKKSMLLWLLVIIMIAIIFISQYLIKILIHVNQLPLFLNFMLLVLMVVLIFQIILVCVNVYYFSKDLELLLPLPIKSTDLLIAKLNTIILSTYFLEFVLILFPLIIYGVYMSAGILFYIYLAIILLIFPILPALIISTIMMFFIKLSKFIKNKDIFQIIITFLFMFFVFFLEFQVTQNIMGQNNADIATQEQEVSQQINIFYNKLEKINTNFLEINPSIKLLNNSEKINSIFNLIKIIFMDFIAFIFFIFIGKITYLKNILKNNNFNTAKKTKKINLQKKCKKKNKNISYINKEFKILFKNPAFFIQCIFPILIIIITLLIILFFAVPNVKALINSNLLGEDITTDMFKFNLNKICLILCGIQLILTFSNASITAFSRDGKDAIFTKYIPIDFHRQIIYKSIPQIIINAIFIFILLILIKTILPNIKLIYYFYIFIIANLLNIFNSILMVVIDIKDPNINWNSEYEIISQNNKKLYQYVLTIFIILLLTYFSKIFSDININLSCGIIIFILLILLIILNLFINKNKEKWFKKIN